MVGIRRGALERPARGLEDWRVEGRRGRGWSKPDSGATLGEPPAIMGPMSAEIAVIVGQGYVGLPLAMRAVAAGYDVVGYDVDEHRAKALAAGTSFVEDITDADVAAALATGRYRAVADPRRPRSLRHRRHHRADAAARERARPHLHRRCRRRSWPRCSRPAPPSCWRAPPTPAPPRSGSARSWSRARGCGRGRTSTSATRPSGSIPATRPTRS